MTRINVIPVTEMNDNFLMAEYFELPRMWPLIYKAIQRNDRDIPETYRLGNGHLKFFYNKIYYLVRRHVFLGIEGKNRGLSLKDDLNINIQYRDVKALLETYQLVDPTVFSFWFQDYLPTAEAMQENLNRLQIRRRYIGGVYEAPVA